MLLLGCFGFGIYNVYRLGTYGNFSSGSLAKDLMAQIQADTDSNLPIIVAENYSYYEMSIYEDMDKLQMERDDKFGVGIDSLDDYLAEHDKVWVIGATNGNGEAALPDGADNLSPIKTLTATNPIHNSTYSATLYEVKDWLLRHNDVVIWQINANVLMYNHWLKQKGMKW